MKRTHSPWRRKAAAAATLLALAAFMLLAFGARAAAQTQPQGGDAEYSRIETAYAQVAKYYNNDLTDSEAMYIARCILYYSDYYDLDARLVVAAIVAESRFKPNAVSPKGAQGLGQLMPGTAGYLGVNNPFDVQQNVFGTVKYLREQYDRWHSSKNFLDLMLAAYNAGPKAVEKFNGIPPYSETRNYVAKVKRLYTFFVYGR